MLRQRRFVITAAARVIDFFETFLEFRKVLPAPGRDGSAGPNGMFFPGTRRTDLWMKDGEVGFCYCCFGSLLLLGLAGIVAWCTHLLLRENPPPTKILHVSQTDRYGLDGILAAVVQVVLFRLRSFSFLFLVAFPAIAEYPIEIPARRKAVDPLLVVEFAESVF